MSADFIQQASDLFGSQLALIDRATGRSLTFAELEDSTGRIAQGLRAQKLAVCATWSPTTLDHLLLLLAALRSGIPIFPISVRWPAETAHALARQSGATLIDPAAIGSGPVKPFQSASEARFATILATSGSSGAPKRVVHALTAHLASARSSQEKIPLQPGCGWLLNLPLAHVSGLSVLFRCLLHGAAIVLPADGEFAAAWQDRRVTHGSVVATQLRRLLEQRVELPNLQALLAGGGPLSTALVNAAIAAGYPIHLTYGMTETCSQITTTRRLIHSAAAFSSGSANPGVQLRLQPSNDGTLPSQGQTLEVKSPTLLLGYLQNDGSIRSAVAADGWFSTGDQGQIDAAGEFWLLGRSDRMFISGGENIHPETIERALEALPEIRRAVVLPVPDETFGQRPAVFIAAEESLTQAFLEQRLSPRLPKFMIPTRIFGWPAEVDPATAKIPLEIFRAELLRISNSAAYLKA